MCLVLSGLLTAYELNSSVDCPIGMYVLRTKRPSFTPVSVSSNVDHGSHALDQLTFRETGSTCSGQFSSVRMLSTVTLESMCSELQFATSSVTGPIGIHLIELEFSLV